MNSDQYLKEMIKMHDDRLKELAKEFDGPMSEEMQDELDEFTRDWDVQSKRNLHREFTM